MILMIMNTILVIVIVTIIVILIIMIRLTPPDAQSQETSFRSSMLCGARARGGSAALIYNII